MNISQEKKESLKGVFWGLIFVGVAALFWYGLVGDPIDEYKIMDHGVPSVAEVQDCVQDVAENDSGQGGAFELCSFNYKVNGNIYGGSATRPEPVEEIEILYLPEHPAIYREQQGAATGFFDWLFRKAILGIVLLLMFVGGGIQVAYSSFKELFAK